MDFFVNGQNFDITIEDEKTILEYVLNSMKNVDACLYYVLTDFASAEKLTS